MDTQLTLTDLEKEFLLYLLKVESTKILSDVETLLINSLLNKLQAP